VRTALNPLTNRPGDRQAIPGILQVYKEGKAAFQVGHGHNLFDYVYIDNAVHAHLLATARLSAPPVPLSTFSSRLRPVSISLSPRTIPTSQPDHIDPPIPASRPYFDTYAPSSPVPPALSVAGETFYITNGEPFPFWAFVRAVYAHYAGPSFSTRVVPLPVPVAYAVAWIGEMWGWMVGKEVALTRERVDFSVGHAWFNIEKARRVLGYEPVVGMEEGIKKAVDVRPLSPSYDLVC